MNQIIILVTLMAFGLSANAGQFKTVTVVNSSGKHESKVSYPTLFSNSVSAYAKINKNLKAELFRSDCSDGEDMLGNGTYYFAQARVVGLNKRYVGFKVSYEDYCGGAHPNHGIYHMSFDSKTGKQLNLETEFGFISYDDPSYDDVEDSKLRRQLSEIMAKNIPSDIDIECYGPSASESAVDMIESFYPTVAGLAKGKTVILQSNPPHVASACQFSIRLKYEKVKKMIVKGSYLHKWLR